MFMDKTQDAIRLIKDGYTEPEIRKMLGYKSGGRVYAIAKKHGLRITKPTEKKAEKVRQLRMCGMTVKEIANELGVKPEAVTSIIYLHAIPSYRTEETRICETCGKEFTTLSGSNQKYCCEKCQRKANRKLATNPDDENAIKALAKYNEDWQYVGGYTGSDGFMDVMHIPCGTVATKSVVTVRHNKIRCDVCSAKESEERAKQRAIEQKRQKEIEREVKRFYKPVKKYKQVTAKECPVCGDMFFGANKYCSDECAKEPTRHRWAMKKNRRKERGWTEESKTISLAKLYERDNGICYLCGGVCEYTDDYNSDNYPTIDHVIPIARGGKDEWKNIRLAHRVCNMAKGVEIVESDAVGISPRS